MVRSKGNLQVGPGDALTSQFYLLSQSSRCHCTCPAWSSIRLRSPRSLVPRSVCDDGDHIRNDDRDDRRGPVGRVSPITCLSPALTAILAFAVLGERPITSGSAVTPNICTPHDPCTRVSFDGRELATEPVDSVLLSRRYLLS